MTYDFNRIQERDIDFIIMRAFSESTEFLDYFLSMTSFGKCDVVAVKHSLFDSNLGESDIVIIVQNSDKKFALHIENKIDAKAMPEQCSRYHKRGNSDILKKVYHDYAVFIIAPNEYIRSNAEAQKYDHIVPYEELIPLFQKLNRPFDCEMLQTSIDKKEKGYTVQEVPEITVFWEKLYLYCSSCNKEVYMYPPSGPKGPRSMWVQFKTPLKGTELYYKSTKGVVDLQFSGKSFQDASLRHKIRPFCDSDMHFADTGNSLSLRINVKTMNFKDSFEKYENEASLMVDAIERFTKLAYTLNDSSFML